jgi:branched-chain amino acid transport system substrate-binding protein
LALIAAACGNDDNAGTEGAADAAAPPTEGGPFNVGFVLPETGPRTFFGPAVISAVELAAQDINEAGGVLGSDVELDGGDEGTPESGAAQGTVDRLLEGGTQWVVGAASSAVSLNVIDRITGSGVGQCSPANTSPTFTDYNDNGLYFRTIASDVLQGQVLGEQIINDGNNSVVIVAVADDFGRGLAEVTEQTVTEAGGEVLETVTYDPEAPDFEPEVSAIEANDPDAVVIIGRSEISGLLSPLIGRGLGPSDIPIYAPEQRREELPQAIDPDDPGVLAGMRGTAAAETEAGDLEQRLSERGVESATLFAPQAYDCVIIGALAAIAAGSTDAEAFGAEVVGVTEGGTTCTSFAECRDLLEEGDDIDYDGVSGPLDFSEAGEPTVGIYDVWEILDSGEFETLDTVTVEME